MKIAKTILKRTIWLGRGTATVMGLAMLLALTVGLASTALAGTGVGARLDLGKLNTVNNATTQLAGSVAGSMLSITNEHRGERVCIDPSERSAARAPGGPPTSPGPTPPQQCFTKPAPALGLAVQPGQNPITVNPEAGTATNLSADELDGRSSSSFATATNGKANDANLLDGKDSTAFASATNGKANDADKLDGKDSNEFLPRTGFYFKETFLRGPGNGKVVFLSVSCEGFDTVTGGGGNGQFEDDVLLSSVPVPNEQGWVVEVRDEGSPSNLFAQAMCADTAAPFRG